MILYIPCIHINIVMSRPNKKGAYDFSDVMRANDVDDAIYDFSLGNVHHAAQTFQQILLQLFSKVLAKNNRSFYSI